tara:strand:- start:1574 stop:2752 length:1179 start_codon:yes stop_codon:yes gene_type:complete
MPIKLNGATNGSVELDVPDAVGSDLQLTLPATAGEVVVKATDGSVDLGSVDIGSSGRVGIGTTSPEELVHINASSSGALVDLLKIDNSGGATGTEAGIVFECGVDRTARISSENTGSDLGALKFWTAGSVDTLSERMRLRSDGNVGINNAGSSGTQFHVNGAAGTAQAIYGQANGSGSTYGVYGYALGGNSTQYGVYGQVGTSSTHASGGLLAYSINTNTYGIVGYWSTAAYYSFYGNGNIAGTAFTNVSDSRLKDVDSNLTGCLDKLANIQPVKYTWKENSQQRRSMGEGLEIGLLAQEVQAQFPELVSDMEWPEVTGANPETLNEQLGTTLGVDYGRMTAVLIQALNEAKVRIETLQGMVAVNNITIDEQQHQISALEARLTTLEGGTAP